jgi:hypothetical protein
MCAAPLSPVVCSHSVRGDLSLAQLVHPCLQLLRNTSRAQEGLKLMVLVWYTTIRCSRAYREVQRAREAVLTSIACRSGGESVAAPYARERERAG